MSLEQEMIAWFPADHAAAETCSALVDYALGIELATASSELIGIDPKSDDAAREIARKINEPITPSDYHLELWNDVSDLRWRADVYQNRVFPRDEDLLVKNIKILYLREEYYFTLERSLSFIEYHQRLEREATEQQIYQNLTLLVDIFDQDLPEACAAFIVKSILAVKMPLTLVHRLFRFFAETNDAPLNPKTLTPNLLKWQKRRIFFNEALSKYRELSWTPFSEFSDLPANFPEPHLRRNWI